MKKNKIILDSTSGNTGVAYAMIGAHKGYSVLLVVPKNVNPQKRKIMEYFGASLILTDEIEGSEGAHKEAKRIYESDPEKYFFANQYENVSNLEAHYNGTAIEILYQTEGKITHFVASFGTGGTLFGVGKRLKELKKNIRIICVQPDDEFHGIEGLRYLPDLTQNGIYVPDVVDDVAFVKTEEAYHMQKYLARKYGLLVGASAAAAACASFNIARESKKSTIVTIFPDRGERYLFASLSSKAL